MEPSPIILLCDYILKLDDNEQIAFFYKRLAHLLATVLYQPQEGQDNTMQYLSGGNNSSISGDTPYPYNYYTDDQQQGRLKTINDISASEGTDLSAIFHDLPSDSAIESIKAFAKYIKVVHRMPSTWDPDSTKLSEDYSIFNDLFSNFNQQFSGISFFCPYPSYDTTWQSNYENWLQKIVGVIQGWSPDDLDQYVKLTKRIVATENRMNQEDHKNIKVLRIIVLAYRQKGLKWAETQREILSILYPETVNYTIYNAVYVKEIRSLKNKRIAKLLLTALLKEPEQRFNPMDLADKILANEEEYVNFLRDFTIEKRND